MKSKCGSSNGEQSSGVFPEIKRAKKDWIIGSPLAEKRNLWFSPVDIEKERLSRAKWAQTLERKLNESKNLMIDNKKDAAWFIIGQVAGELLRQAELDEGVKRVRFKTSFGFVSFQSRKQKGGLK